MKTKDSTVNLRIDSKVKEKMVELKISPQKILDDYIKQNKKLSDAWAKSLVAKFKA